MGIDKESFPEILEEANRLPESNIYEILSPFSNPLPKGEKLVSLEQDYVEAKKAPKYNYKAHLRRYVISDDETQITAYEGIINQALSGDIIIRFEERSITKDGDVIILLSWLEPLPEPKKSGNEVI